MYRHTHHIIVSVLVTLETPHQSEVLWDWGFWLLITTNDLREIWKSKALVRSPHFANTFGQVFRAT